VTRARGAVVQQNFPYGPNFPVSSRNAQCGTALLKQIAGRKANSLSRKRYGRRYTWGRSAGLYDELPTASGLRGKDPTVGNVDIFEDQNGAGLPKVSCRACPRGEYTV
jgi:hypothetical protein